MNLLIGSSQFIANLSARELLPRSYDLRYCPSIHWLEKDMHVIRHHDPLQQPVTLRIKGQQRSLHHVCNAWLEQDARPMTSVHPRVQPLAAFGIPLRGGESLQFSFQSSQDRLRQAVSQMKRHMLHHLGTLKVRQISPAMPHPGGVPGEVPGSANLLIGGLALPGSAILPNGALSPSNRKLHPAHPA